VADTHLRDTRFRVDDAQTLSMLREMEDEIKREKAMRSALRRAAKPIRDRAIDLVPVQTGALKKSIRFRSRKVKGAILGFVEAGSSEAFYAHLVEFGTSPHFQKKSTRFKRGGGQERRKRIHPGTAESPFLRPAFDENHREATRVFADDLRERITRSAKRGAAKGHRESLRPAP
jgi:HK97 gp10 family phage protein